MRRGVLGIGIAVAAGMLAAASPPKHDPDEGLEGSIRLGIPEPMVFDLVRPLGAAKGEFEINSLFVQPATGNRPLKWAPEVEYSFRQGTAVEFELPVEGAGSPAYKFGLQHKLPVARSRPFTHGLQGLAEFNPKGAERQVTGLYLFGVRWRERWSTLSMAGTAWERTGAGTAVTPLANHAVFYERWRRTVVGLEVNSRWGGASRGIMWMPQTHFRLVERVNLQVGAGLARSGAARSPVVGWRLIREF